VALTPLDQKLLQRCLNKHPGAWNDFVERFIGLIYHTIHHTAHQRSIELRPEDVEDVAAEILLQIVAKDYQVLREFRGGSSLSTYLVVIARRTCIHELNKRSAVRETQAPKDVEAEDHAASKRSHLESLEEVQKLLSKLPSRERQIVQMYYLEGRTYEEISTELDIPVNTIGPILSRIRKRLGGSAPAKTPPARATRKSQEPDT